MRKIIVFMAAVLAFQVGNAAAQTCPEDVGAALAAACPCDSDSNGQSWKNHGQYVKCVVHLRNELRKDGCLDAEAKRTIAKCAARSTCGKEGFVLCCFYDTSGTCSDVTPNGIPEGVCSNDDTIACDTATDCVTVTGPRISRSEDNCTDRGGTSIGGGSVCGGCPALPPQ